MSGPGPAAAYPAVRRTPVTETYFGVSVTDAYRWMENRTPEFEAWLRAQNAFARGILDASPCRPKVVARLRELGGGLDSVGSVKSANGSLFFLRRASGSQSYALWMKAADSSKERLLLDVDTPSGSHRSIDFFVPSPSGRFVAYGISDNGSEVSTLSLFDVEQRRTLPQVGPRIQYARVRWLSEDELLYTDYLVENPDKTNGRAVYLHRLGTDYRKDIPVFGPKLSPIPLVDDPLPSAIIDPTGDSIGISVNRGVLDPSTVFAKRKDQLRSPNSPWTVIATPDDGIDAVAFRANAVYTLSHKEAPRRRVEKATLQDGKLIDRHVIVPSAKGVIQDLLVAKDSLYTLDLDAGFAAVRRLDWDGRPQTMPSLPVLGESDTASANPFSDGILLRLENVTMPERWYRFRPNSESWERLPILGEPNLQTVPMVASRFEAKSADGTLVPVDVYHRKDLKLDGTNPTLLNVYGSYGIPLQPGFLAPRLVWLEQGGVLAYAHVRGGGEFGDDWHRAGQKGNKQRSVDDFIAAARGLMARGYSSPEHLGAISQSAGAVVASMGVWQHPELFGVALFGSGMLQALRSEFSKGGIANTAEFGTVANEADFKGLLAMDALQHTRSDMVYPPMLFSVGANDPRVAPWESAKVVAQLQSIAKTRGPILLRVDFNDGHGGNSTADSEGAKFADYYSFAFDHLRHGGTPGRSP